LPLKEHDLKDTEAYKKASRSDLPKVAGGKAKFWIYKDIELPNPAGKKIKHPAFLALVDDAGIRKKLAGKRIICKGICGMQEGKVAFQPTLGKVPYKQLKASLPPLLGKAVFIPTGVDEEADEGEGEETEETDETAPTSAPPTTAPVSASSLSGAWAQLVKDVQAYAAAHPERKDELFREMAAISALLKANNVAEAKPRMDRVQAMLVATPESKPDGKPGEGAAQAGARWTALAKQAQALIAARPETKADLSRAGAGIPDLIRAGKLDQANKQMDVLEAALRGNSDENPREKEYRARYQAIEGKLAAALKDPARDAGRLRSMDAFIVEKADGRDFESALKALANLEEVLATAPGPAPKSRPGIDYKISLLNWEKAKKQVHAELGKLEAAIVKEFAEEPKISEIKSSLKKLEQVLGGFDERLRDKLDEAMNAKPDDLPPLHEEALGILEEYLDYVDTDGFIDAVDSNPFVPVSVREPLDTTLNEIAGQLRA
jgi:hypothetical protein